MKITNIRLIELSNLDFASDESRDIARELIKVRIFIDVVTKAKKDSLPMHKIIWDAHKLLNRYHSTK